MAGDGQRGDGPVPAVTPTGPPPEVPSRAPGPVGLEHPSGPAETEAHPVASAPVVPVGPVEVSAHPEAPPSPYTR